MLSRRWAEGVFSLTRPFLHQIAAPAALRSFRVHTHILPLAQLPSAPTFTLFRLYTGMSNSSPDVVAERLSKLSLASKPIVVTHAPQSSPAAWRDALSAANGQKWVGPGR